MNELYFHEDDYCQIELLPIENEDYVETEINNINGFSEEHKTSDGIGWTDMYIRNNIEQIKLKDYKINHLELDAILSKFAERCEKIYTGYSSYREECKNTFGYRKNEIAIFFSFEENIVTNIWFDFYLDELEVAKDLYNILKTISNKYNLLFVHWSFGYYSKIKTDLGLEKKLISFCGQNIKNNEK
jgi:hypothetical protein